MDERSRRAAVSRFVGVLPVAAVLAGLAMSTWALAPVLAPHVQPAQVGELVSKNVPFWWLHAAGTGAAGALATVVALYALVRLPVRPLSVAGWLALALFGLSALLGAVAGKDCAESLDTACRRIGGVGPLTFSHYMHTAAEVFSVAAAGVAMLTLGVLARQQGWSRAFTRAVPPLLVLYTASAAAVSLLRPGMLAATAPRWPDLVLLAAADRALHMSLAVWLILLGYALWTRPA
ncbi:DUF998 domain-containing protein [Allonocardiopsis opalescens]|uniref:Uncharacterized protein DUF998 n=1 Tax=Allonocardiopsis opalescens TaxID=1144618 RepID=A0A2T0Q9K1_9ACTN|nr:DUF998 domain-containing protein [Allonocardiopsis opalescens]PRY00569.1 uncharacterized protein DUF998 [Allonocardiopsis opalescens]